LYAGHEVSVAFGGIISDGVMSERMAAQGIAAGCGGGSWGRIGDGALPNQTGRA
jgi:hypothetical protein